MILTHWSANPLTEILARPNQPEGEKPRGLWLSDETDFGWKEWCDGEDFRPHSFAFRADFSVDTSRVLHIKGCGDLEDFHFTHSMGSDFIGSRMINWPAVAEKWSGIVITPYLWNMRLSDVASWYYGWDCASGCIWGPTVLTRIPAAAAA